MQSSKSPLLNLTCPHCKKTNSRKYSWIDPGQFLNPSKAELTSTFFCAHCSKGIAIKLLFKPDKTIEFLEDLEYKSLINENSPAFWIEDIPEEDEIKELGEDFLTLLNDPKAMDEE